MLRRPRPKRVRRAGQFDPSNLKTGAPIGVSFSVVSTKLRCTFSTAVSLVGTPQYVATGGAHVGNALPTGVSRVNATTWDLDYAANVAVDDTITVPDRDPAVRNASGGYVDGQTVTL